MLHTWGVMLYYSHVSIVIVVRLLGFMDDRQRVGLCAGIAFVFSPPRAAAD